MGTKIDELMKEFNKKEKDKDTAPLVHVGMADYTTYNRIPFTSPRMNYCTFGGLPIGKMAEFYGEEHSGKTTTSLDIVANYQHMEYSRPVLYCDCENTLDAEWARKLGVDTDSLIVLNPTSQCAEDIFEFVLQMVETGEIGLFVIDSLGVMVSKEAMEKTIDQKTYAGISRPLTAFSNKVEMAMQKHQVTGICINQVRENLNSSWGGLTTPGGKAFKHVCSVRMQFSKGKYIDERGNELTRSAESPAGNIVLMSMEKNKTCPPTRRTGQYTLNYSIGIDYLKDLVDVAIKYEIIDKKGAWFSIIDIETGEVIANNIQGQANVNEYLEAHDEVLKRVEELIDSKILI